MTYPTKINKLSGVTVFGRSKNKQSGKVLASVLTLVLLGGAAYAATVALKDKAPVNGNVVAKIDGKPVYESEVESQFTLLNKDQTQKVPFVSLNETQKEAIIKELAAQKLLVAKAKEQGLDQDVAVQAKVNQLLKDAMLKEVVKSSITGDTVKARYEALVKDLANKEEIQARHILVKTEDEAKKVAAKLKNKGTSFEKLAKEYSIDVATAETGGDLGGLITGTMLKEFEQAALALEKGEISKPVQTSAGWHIIKLEGRQPAKAMAYEQVKQKIAQDLSNKAIKDYVADLLKDVEIKVEGANAG